ncbi:MAG: hypothetical protein R2827_11130 [Bdellovibrionales bacterium]
MQAELNPIISFLGLILRHRLPVVAFMLFSLVGTLIHHKLNPAFFVSARLYVMSPSGSPTMSIAEQVSGIQINPYASMDLPDKYLKVLHSNSFEMYLVKYIESHKDYVVQHGLNVDGLPSKDLADKLLGQIEFKKVDSDTLDIIAYSPSKNVAVGIANFISEAAKDALVDHESREIEDSLNYLKQEIADARHRIDAINQSIFEIQTDNSDSQLSFSPSGRLQVMVLRG